jgi:hypothetical protein
MSRSSSRLSGGGKRHNTAQNIDQNRFFRFEAQALPQAPDRLSLTEPFLSVIGKPTDRRGDGRRRLGIDRDAGATRRENPRDLRQRRMDEWQARGHRMEEAIGERILVVGRMGVIVNERGVRDEVACSEK